MKILHVVHAYPPSIGGSQWFVKNISEHLVHKYDDEVTVFTTVAHSTDYFHGRSIDAFPTGTYTENGVVIRRFPVFNKLNFLRKAVSAFFYRLRLPYNDWMRTLENGPIIFGLTDAITKSNADVILAMAFPLLHMYNALAGAKQANIPIVFAGALHTADLWGYDRAMIIRAIQQADGYIALTEHEKLYLVDKGISADKVWVTGAGVDLQPIDEAVQKEFRMRLGLGDDLVIAAVGKHSERKRFTFLLDAMSIVWQKHPDIYVIIAGTASAYTQVLQAYVQNLSVEQQKRVSILRDIDDIEKTTLLATADLFVHPAIDESFGIVLIEAWANGTPVIGADTAVNRCLVESEVDGLLFQSDSPADLATQILALAEDRQQRTSMGKAGYEKVLANYTWVQVTRQIRDVYHSLTSNI